MKLLYSTRIYQLRLRHPGPLPELNGRWRRRGGLVRVDDPSPRDIAALAAARLPLEGFGVALDARPLTGNGLSLRDLHALLISHLHPSPSSQPAVGRGRRLDSGRGLLCIGDSKDPVRIRCFLRAYDGDRLLPPDEHSVRVEVEFATTGCRQLGLRSSADLPGFNLRHKMAPYFQFAAPDTPQAPPGLAYAQPAPGFRAFRSRGPARPGPAWPGPYPDLNRAAGQALRQLTQKLRYAAR